MYYSAVVARGSNDQIVDVFYTSTNRDEVEYTMWNTWSRLKDKGETAVGRIYMREAQTDEGQLALTVWLY